MKLNALHNISPLDGRYHQQNEPLRHVFSEYALIKYRVEVEVAWLLALAKEKNIPEVPTPTAKAKQALNAMVQNFDEQSALRVKEIEKTTNHDVKAVEYFIKESMKTNNDLAPLGEFIHFACTSEDINNISHALMLNDGRKILLKSLNEITKCLKTLAKEQQNTPMLTRTHGQAASPSTMGKEIANVYHRLNQQIIAFQHLPIRAKINGAIGNFNAHISAYPNVDWPKLAEIFITEFGLNYNPMTSQIEPHDYIAEYFHQVSRINTILLDFSRDVWGYVSLGYFKQKTLKGEVGSSTMPHKVNPIDFENAEGNLGLSNALAQHLANKLPISRWQRDLSDSTVLRNLGVACGYALTAYLSLVKGMGKISVDEQMLKQDLNNNWQVLAEPIQTVMRRYGIANPYEQLKTLTRGKTITQETFQAFIDELNLPKEIKQQLKQLTPHNYIGLAQQLVRDNL